jgi:hypothetical protein
MSQTITNPSPAAAAAANVVLLSEGPQIHIVRRVTTDSSPQPSAKEPQPLRTSEKPKAAAPGLAWLYGKDTFSDVEITFSDAKSGPIKVHRAALGALPALLEVLSKHADPKKPIVLPVGVGAGGLLLRHLYQVPLDLKPVLTFELVEAIEQLASVAPGLTQELWDDVERRLMEQNGTQNGPAPSLLLSYINVASKAKLTLGRLSEIVPWEVVRAMTKDAIVYLLVRAENTKAAMAWTLAWAATHTEIPADPGAHHVELRAALPAAEAARPSSAYCRDGGAVGWRHQPAAATSDHG